MSLSNILGEARRRAGLRAILDQAKRRRQPAAAPAPGRVDLDGARLFSMIEFEAGGQLGRFRVDGVQRDGARLLVWGEDIDGRKFTVTVSGDQAQIRSPATRQHTKLSARLQSAGVV